MAGENLTQARKNKNDEFYTQLSDIEKELRHYKEHFKGKTIFCNCDDPEWSNFWKYFSLNFEELGLKKLISTHYEQDKPSYKLEIIADINNDGRIDDKDVVKTNLTQNGDFRSPEAIEILKEADIIITNPPFSLFREYIALLEEYNKKYLIVGNYNSVTYKDIFKLIKNNKLWTGVSPRSMNFKLPDGTLKGVNACWFTNLEHNKRSNEEIILWKSYYENELDYPKYDNYNVVEVSKVNEIPIDFDGAMGVPITFFEKYNPNQFEILGMSASAGYDQEIVGIDFKGEKDARPLINGKNTYARIFIKKKQNISSNDIEEIEIN
jgi:hypothetical protein